MKSLHDPKYLEFISRIKKIRESKGLSQVELAILLGKPQSYISKVETCERRIDFIETLQVCEALKIGLSAVIPAESKYLLNHNKEEE